MNIKTSEQAEVQLKGTACEYCDGTGDVHSLDGQWRGECNQCPAAAQHAFKNFHRQLCERFGYGHDEKDWRRDQLSLIEFIAAKAQAPAVGDDALDAKRYRFIKSYDNPDSPLAICSWCDVGWDGEWAIEHNPDDVIDAAMASHPPVQGSKP